MARRAPVICLGNARLPEDKRRDFDSLGVDQVVLVSNDWWPVLTEFAAAAAIVVAFVSKETTHINMELRHLTESGRAFVLASSPETHARMLSNPAYAAALETPRARHVSLNGPDARPLEAALDAAYNQQLAWGGSVGGGS
jgi:hypothetical protein